MNWFGRVAGTRELIEAPHIVGYEVRESAEELAILAVMHGAQSH